MAKKILKVYIPRNQETTILNIITKNGSDILDHDLFFANMKNLIDKNDIIAASKVTYSKIKTAKTEIELATTVYNFDVKKGNEYDQIRVIAPNKYLRPTDAMALDNISAKGIKIHKLNSRKKLAVALASFTIITMVAYKTNVLQKTIDVVTSDIQEKMAYDEFKELSYGLKGLQQENMYRREQNMPTLNMFGQLDPANYDDATKLYTLYNKKLAELGEQKNTDALWDKFWNTNENVISSEFTQAEKEQILTDFYNQKSAYEESLIELNLKEGKAK